MDRVEFSLETEKTAKLPSVGPMEQSKRLEGRVMSSKAQSVEETTSVQTSRLAEEETAPAIESLSGTEAPAPFSGEFIDLPYDVKRMIWGSVVCLPRVVEVEASIMRIKDASVKDGPPKYRLILQPSYHTFESMYVCQESRKITQSLLRQRSNWLTKDTVVYLRNFEGLCRELKSILDPGCHEARTSARRTALLKQLLDSELLYIEDIRCLAIDVDPNPWRIEQCSDGFHRAQRTESMGGRLEYAASIFPVLEAFRDLEELKVILNINLYTKPTQKPSRLLVGSAHLLNVGDVAGSTFDSGWHLESPGRQALYDNYFVAMSNAWWGVLENGLKLMEVPTITPPGQTFLTLDPRWSLPNVGCTRNLPIKIAQWQKPEEIRYRHGGSKSGRPNELKNNNGSKVAALSKTLSENLVLR